MEMIKYSVLALVASCAAPAYAEECFPVADALANMTANGYQVSFKGDTEKYSFYVAQNKDGGWVMFAIVGNTLCPMIGGTGSVNTPLPPNT